MDFRRRKLQYEERRAMIERGMELPPLPDSPSDSGRRRDPAARRERSLHAGVTLAFPGVGLGVAAWLLQNVIVNAFIPAGLAGPWAVGAAVVLSIGLGNLVYFSVTKNRMGEGALRPWRMQR